MRQWLKVVLWVVGVLVAIPVLWVVTAVAWLERKSRPSDVIDFKPVSFEAEATGPFFYSIGNSLKYAKSIDPNARTLLAGPLRYVQVSPDNRYALATINDTLYVVAANGAGTRAIAMTGGGYEQSGPPGQRFLDSDTYAWSVDSRSVFYIMDEYAMKDSVRRYSEKGELWEYDVASGQSRRIADRFAGYSYAVTDKGDVYYVQSDGAGGAEYARRSGNDVQTVRPKDRLERTDFVALAPPGTRFRVISNARYEPDVVEALSEHKRPDRSLDIRHRDRVLFVITEGYGFKGPYHCLRAPDADFLPGGRYAVMRVRCSNHSGELLIDVETGRYRTLPEDTRVYPPVRPMSEPA